MGKYFEFFSPVKLLSGEGALENIPYELKILGASKPLILAAEPIIANKTIDVLLKSLEDYKIDVGDVIYDIPIDSSIEVVNTISKIYRIEGCDSIIAIGGGSIIDTAKGVNIIVSLGGESLLEYQGVDSIDKNLKPLIVAPSTSGTGSEATAVSVIANKKKNIKMEFISYKVVPNVAVLDPRLTISLPMKLTASTGIDALVHAIEAYSCLQKNIISDIYAKEAIKLLVKNLNNVIVRPKDKDIRLNLLLGSFLAGAAFSNSMVGIVHAIGHSVGAVCGISHSDAMTILLLPCMKKNIDLCSLEYGEILDIIKGEKLMIDNKSEKCIEELKSLLDMLHDKARIPLTLREVGVKKEDFKEIARISINDGAAILNPLNVSEQVVFDILEEAY
ncbi:iron-containing alcohol dehydrogenase [Oceanirhabdus sp. W0125-5]|uniref:iron-containing alcohol dehydrogenase n=1 Tax=Oceanirhabdus sp. W0125-5 TaxID=2999116 RepID=UPI0022F2AE74|nr:iron-containing alcohol dehydrogenase [Oceanirhabdus sp. W0125-5]WBW94765.1 iron-containing alcohol dehydrogenase [Oceanirhabdus sp. W0125-5]